MKSRAGLKSPKPGSLCPSAISRMSKMRATSQPRLCAAARCSASLMYADDDEWNPPLPSADHVQSMLTLLRPVYLPSILRSLIVGVAILQNRSRSQIYTPCPRLTFHEKNRKLSIKKSSIVILRGQKREYAMETPWNSMRNNSWNYHRTQRLSMDFSCFWNLRNFRGSFYMEFTWKIFHSKFSMEFHEA